MSERPRQCFGLTAFEGRYIPALELDDTCILAGPVHVDDVVEIGPLGSLCCRDGRMNVGVDAGFELLQLRLFHALRKLATQGGDGIAHLPLPEFFGAAIAHFLVFARADMTAEPIRCDLDAAWTFAGANLRSNAFQRLKQEQDVISIVLLEGYSERLRALGKFAHRLTLLDWRVRGVFVVFADDEKRKPMKRREVEDFVGDTLVEDAVTDDGNADVVDAPIFLRERAAKRHEKRSPDDRPAVKMVVVRGELHGARDAEVGAGLLAVELGHHRFERSAFREVVAVRAVVRHQDVVGTNDARQCRGHRLLTDAEMHGTTHLVGRMIFRHENLFRAADEIHRPVKLEARLQGTTHGRGVADCVVRGASYSLVNVRRKGGMLSAAGRVRFYPPGPRHQSLFMNANARANACPRGVRLKPLASSTR